MLITKKRMGLYIYSALLAITMLTTGCASHLDKGWGHFSKGDYNAAQTEWKLEEKEDLSEPMAKATAALAIVDQHGKAVEAKEAKKYPEMVKHSIAIAEKDQWENKDWLMKSPILKQYIDESLVMIEEGYQKILGQLKQKALDAKKGQNYAKMLRYSMGMVEAKSADTQKWFEMFPTLQALDDEGHQLVEESNYLVFTDYQKQKFWLNIKQDYESYVSYTKTFKQVISDRNRALYQLALSELDKQAKAMKEFDAQLDCAKAKFLEEAYDVAMQCIQKADGYVKRYPDVKFNVEELDYVRQSTEQAIKIQQEIEAEKRRIAEAERLRIEEENRKAAEAQKRQEEELRRQEKERILLAQAAERQRLIKEAEERRKEAERKRIIEERNRRWRAFLAQGAPLKPLVTTVLRPSEGIGTLPMGKSQKWQGGSQLPKPKDKSIASEDVYALEVEVPKTHKLNYLRNYYKGSSRERNMLGAPQTQGGKRSYYTENFKGGRYYIEVKNEKAKEKKYEIKTRIYKIPVTF